MSTSNGRPPAVSGGDEKEDNVVVVPIYLRVMAENGGMDWFVIKTDSQISEVDVPASPVFVQEPDRRSLSGLAVVGSILYSIGGVVPGPPPPNAIPWRVTKPVSDVYYIDTHSPEDGWKKLPRSLPTPRISPHAFTVNGGSKIYVMGGDERSGRASPKPEVLDTHCKGWRQLGDSKDVPGLVDGHAILDGGKRVLVISRASPHLFCYNVVTDSWKRYRKSVFRCGYDTDMDLTACVDGFVYFMDPTIDQGFMFGVDVSRTNSQKPKRVILGNETTDWDWLPPPFNHPDYNPPRTNLIALGQEKLAAIWSFTRCDTGYLHIYCSTIKMCKVKNKDGQYDFVAYPLSLSDIYVPGVMFMDCIAVFPPQTKGPQEIPAKDENHTCGSNKKKSDSKKHMNKNK